MTAVFRRLLAIGRPAWGRLAVAGMLGTAGALATVGLLAGSGYVVDRASFRPGLGAIAGLLAAVEVLAFVRGPLRYGERLLAHDTAFRSLTGWRLWLYDRLEPLSPAGLRAWRSGDLLARATEDVDALQDLYVRVLLPVVVTVAAAVLAVVVVGVLLPWAALVLGLSLALAMMAAPAVALAARPEQGLQAAVRGQLAAEIVDLLQAAPDLVAFGQEAAMLERAGELDAELTRLARRRALGAGAASAVLVACLGAAVVGVLAVGAAAVHDHRLSAVMLAVLPLAAIGAFESVPTLALAAVRAGDVAAAGRRLLELEQVALPVVDPARPRPLPAGCPPVSFERVRLRYRDDRPWALDGVDLELAPGTTTAVVGSSGAGKSSLVNVLLRFWSVSEGQVRLGDVPLDQLAQAEVRRACALLDQEAWLSSGTIRRNVTLARPRASDEEVARVLALAHLEEWVATLPQGLDTPVGEGGVRLSGGQRQRLALARTLLAGGDVLVLDEPTSGLDRATAAALLRDLLAGHEQSVLMVTHRQAETAGFDRVVEMADGRVVGSAPGAGAASLTRPETPPVPAPGPVGGDDGGAGPGAGP